jgi:hypothetical protein
MYEQDDARVSSALQARNLARAHRIHHSLPQDWLQSGDYDEQPEKIAN